MCCKKCKKQTKRDTGTVKSQNFFYNCSAYYAGSIALLLAGIGVSL
ncbi:hypothetical protein pEaSNUABM38_00238 [Erwinia phage pEa_SNUABM_38]|nr:hypothetical protein pEaSNUABM38_00238 [Erwinia phage pEa_SNUABM_38]